MLSLLYPFFLGLSKGVNHGRSKGLRVDNPGFMWARREEEFMDLSSRAQTWNTPRSCWAQTLSCFWTKITCRPAAVMNLRCLKKSGLRSCFSSVTMFLKANYLKKIAC